MVEYEISGSKYRVRIGSASALLAADNDGIARHIIQGHRWEEQSLERWADMVEPGTAVVDVGAYTGVYSLLAVALGASEVYAFEPNSRNRHRLRNNVALLPEELGSRISVFGEALWWCSAEMSLSGDSGAHHRLCSGGRLLPPSAGGRVVRTAQMDAMLPEDSSPISAIKIDVEGAELRVLQGARATVNRHHPRILVECLDLNHWEAVRSEMRDYTPIFGPMDGRNYDLRWSGSDE